MNCKNTTNKWDRPPILGFLSKNGFYSLRNSKKTYTFALAKEKSIWLGLVAQLVRATDS